LKNTDKSMKKQLAAAGFILLSISLPLKASAATFSKLFVFGDSLSDPGNVFNATKALGDPTKVLPPSPPYFNGRFSNGPVWAEYFGNELGLSPTPVTVLGNQPAKGGINFAFGGSTTGKNNAIAPDVPTGILTQVDLFTKPLEQLNQKADPDALYAIWGGANDYLFGNNLDPTVPIANLTSTVKSLADVGAKNIMVFNLPDLGQLPSTSIDPATSPGLSTLTGLHNSALSATLAGFQQSGLNIIPVDVDSLVKEIKANPVKFGFKDVTNSCLVGDFKAVALGTATLCNNPDDFAFFDGVHPSTRVHNLIAQAALSKVKYSATSVPEPSAGIGIVALGAIGMRTLKRKNQKLRKEVEVS
jgi:phospholipase/lecithinase/hemolysin